MNNVLKESYQKLLFKIYYYGCLGKEKCHGKALGFFHWVEICHFYDFRVWLPKIYSIKKMDLPPRGPSNIPYPVYVIFWTYSSYFRGKMDSFRISYDRRGKIIYVFSASVVINAHVNHRRPIDEWWEWFFDGWMPMAPPLLPSVMTIL